MTEFGSTTATADVGDKGGAGSPPVLLDHPWANLGGSMARGSPPPSRVISIADKATNSPQRAQVYTKTTSTTPPNCAQRDISSRAWHSANQTHRDFEVCDQNIRFGAFSLGDILEQQIRKFGGNAFHGKKYHKQSAARFISSFTESMNQEVEMQNQAGIEQSKQRSRSDVQNRGVVPDDISDIRVSGSKPVYPSDTCVEGVYQTRSWSNREGGWFWVPKATALVAIERNLGFPATAAEVRRFHPWSRKVIKAKSQRVDGRSFAAVLKQESMDRDRDGGYRPQTNPWSRLGSRDGPGRYGDGRDWRGTEDRRQGENFNRGEDQARFNTQRGDFRQNTGGSNSGDNQKRDFRSGSGGQYAGEYHMTDNRAGADANRGGYNTGPRGDDIERGGASKRRMTDREDWPAENDLRNKIIRNQDERGRPDFYRSDKIEGGWDYRGKGGGHNSDLHCFNCNKSGHYQKTAKTLLIVTAAEKMVIKVPCAQKRKDLEFVLLAFLDRVFTVLEFQSKRGLKKELKG